ncbi:MAG TPA: DoxX family protein [Rhodanobacter sp.]|nr:DoxX family protein [Rhodanobacter sp.]
MRDLSGSLFIRWVALLLLCAAYVQGGIDKAANFGGAAGEMQHFGLTPPALFAAMTIVLELGASLLILTGFYRWLGALALAVFTLMATFMAARFWELPPLQRMPAANTFFEHFGLVGGFLLVAWHDLRERRAAST